MKKDFLNLKRSRWLLLSLFALLVGASPTWADAYTCGFEKGTDGWAYSYNSSTYGYDFGVGTGWSLKGSTLNFTLGSTYLQSGETGLGYTNSNTSNYLITPKLAKGTITLYGKGSKSDNTGCKIYLYKCTEDNGEFTIGNQIQATYNGSNTTVNTSYGGLSTKDMRQFSYELDEDSYVAILIGYAGIDDFVAANGLAKPVEGPVLVVKDGSKVTSPYAYDFGLATAGTTHKFTLSNPGTAAVEGLTVSETGSFGATLSATSIAAGETATLTVTMPEATGNSTITISSTSDGIDDFVINVSGTIRDANKVYLDFADGLMPDGWTSVAIGSYASSYGSPWSASTGYVSQSGSGSSYEWAFTSPLLTFTEGETIFFETEKYGTSTWSSPSIKVQYSTDGSSWTTIGSAYTDDVADSWKSRSAVIPTADAKYIRFSGWYVKLRNIYGGQLPDGANFAIDTDGTTQNFGVASIGGVAEKKFTITNSGNAALPVTFTDATDFYVAKTVMFTKPNSWTGDKLYMYAWDGSGALTAAYPGYEVTEAAQNDMSQWVYTVRLPKGATGIKFSDNASHETGDISTTSFKDIIGLWLDGSEIKTWKNEDFSVPADGSASFYVRMLTATAGAKSGNIALAFEALNATSFTIPVSGTVVPDGLMVVDFNNNLLPEGWGNNASNKWSFDEGKAYCTSAAELTTPMLQFAEGDMLVIKATSYDDYDNNYLEITGSVDGTNWDAFTKKFISRSQIPYGPYATLVVTDIPTTVKYLKFKGFYVRIDEIAGLKYSDDAPVLGYYTNSECTSAATATVTKNFDFVAEAPDAQVYYMKNDGTGSMTIALGDVPAGFTATLGKTTLASGESTTLTINMPAETKGYHNGNIVVTAKNSSDEEIGTFTVTASGVMMEAGKLNLNFASTDVIPATWTATDWTKNDGGYYRGVYSSTTMETSTLTATAGEEIVIVAKQEYASGSFSVNYKKVDAEEWSTLIASTSLGNNGWVTLHAPITEAGDYKIQIIGNYNTQIQRIYGLTAVPVPFMETTAADIAFGMKTEESAEQSFTISNVGDAAMTGLSLTLGKTDDAAEYSIRMTDSEDAEFTGTTLAAGQTINVYVKQLFDLESLGSKSDVLTIAADGQTTKTINLTGATRDPSVLYVDFDDPNSFPEGWQAGDNWSVYTYGADRYAYQSDSKTPSALVTTPLAVAGGQTLSFKVARYTSAYGYTTSLKTRYSQDGGATWSEYEAQYGEGSSNAAGSGYTTIELSELPAGNLIFEFFGNNIKLDLIQGVKTATAPALALTEGSTAVANGDKKAFENLKAEGTATYTLKNIGNADMVSTVAVTGGATVALSGEGEGVTIADKTVTLAAGKSATITLTVPFESPYSDMSGAMTITTEGWVGDMTVNYTAELVDPTDFVEDFSGNARPAGWYSETAGAVYSGWIFTGGNASIYAGSAKPLITEKIGAEDGKNVLSFDAKAYNGDSQTLSVYTSTDRKNWGEAKVFNLTGETQTFNLTPLADGEYYVKFEAANATIDNITGVKKLTAPEHDLFEVSNTLTATAVPGASYTATVTAISLVADETDIVAELWVEKNEVGTKVASLVSQTLTANVNKTLTLTGDMPNVEGEYQAWITVKKSDDAAYFNTDKIAFTLAHNPALTINSFTATTPVQADDNNQYTATFNVNVTNTGSRDLTAGEVSVSLIDKTTEPLDVHTATWTAANSQTVFLNPGEYANDGAVLALYSWGKEEAWTLFTETSIDGFYSAELNGNTGFNIVRLKKSTDDGYSSDNGGLNWSNKYNQSVDYTVADGNVFTFANWAGDKQSFEVSTMSTLAKGVSTTLQVTVSGTLTDGENKDLTFYAREDVKNTIKVDGYTYESQTAAITAAPVITLNETDGTVASTGENRKVALSRTFVKGWNTICLPFAVAVTDIHAEAKALDFTAYNSSTNELTFSPVDALEANKPYVIYVPEAINEALNFSGKTVTTAADPETAINGVTFQGTYSPIDDGSLNGKWGLTATGKIAKASSSTTMSGFRAYFDGIPANATARFVGFDDDVPTGISIVGTDAAAEGAYNLKGQKVEQLRKGGLYIINGKKQVVK